MQLVLCLHQEVCVMNKSCVYKNWNGQYGGHNGDLTFAIRGWVNVIVMWLEWMTARMTGLIGPHCCM